VIAVRLALGKFSHLAEADGKRTLCGREFSVGFDGTRALRTHEKPEDLCRKCGEVRRRRLKREGRG
jgi:hypothetical protein